MTQWWREDQEQDAERSAGRTWCQVWAMNFYKLPAPQEWVDELNGAWKMNVHPDEMLYAVRDMAVNKDTHARPTLRDLMFAIKRRRAAWHERQRGQRREGSLPSTTCLLCAGIGFLSFSVTEGGEVVIPTPMRWPLPIYSAPCGCQAGDREKQIHWQAYQAVTSEIRAAVIDGHRRANDEEDM